MCLECVGKSFNKLQLRTDCEIKGHTVSSSLCMNYLSNAKLRAFSLNCTESFNYCMQDILCHSAKYALREKTKSSKLNFITSRKCLKN